MAQNNDLTRLRNLRDQINKAKDDIAQAKGTRAQLMKQLKDQFNCTSIEDAEALLQTYQNNLQKITQDIKRHISELEDTYGNF